MAAPNELEARVAALETQIAELAEQVRTSKQDVAAARVLAGGADRDVTEIRAEIQDFRQATTSSFNAMRDDLRGLGWVDAQKYRAYPFVAPSVADRSRTARHEL